MEVDPKAGKHIRGYEYAVLVTNLDHEVLTLGQLYRDRADAENSFDELKNQWGWGGFTTHDLHRCRLSARAVALVYNWWSLYVRLANPEQRREAITSRPWLMTSVGRRTEHAGQTTITLTAMHAEFKTAREALMRVSRLLQHWVKEAAEQFDGKSVWHRCCEHLKQILAGIGPPKKGAGNHLCERLTAVFRITGHAGPEYAIKASSVTRTTSDGAAAPSWSPAPQRPAPARRLRDRLPRLFPGRAAAREIARKCVWRCTKCKTHVEGPGVMSLTPGK